MIDLEIRFGDPVIDAFEKFLVADKNQDKLTPFEIVKLFQHGLICPDSETNSGRYVLSFIGVQLEQHLW